MTIKWTESTVKVSALKPYERNPRKISDAAYGRLKASIEKLGYHQRCVAQPDGRLIGGHQRLKVFKELGIKEIQILIPDRELTEDEYRQMLVQDNLPFGDFDFEILAADFSVEELTDWGMPEDWLKELEIPPQEGLTDPDDIPEAPEAPVTLVGDVWLLGGHRLMCGDSTKADDVAKLMDGQKAQMLFADPPYGMNYDASMSDTVQPKGEWCNNPKNYANVIGDDADFDPAPLIKIFNGIKEQFWWGADYYAERIPNKNKGSWLIWDKRAGVEDLKWTTSEFESCWSKQRHHRCFARIRWHGLIGMEKDDTKSRLHPTQKPNELARFVFEKWGKEGDIIIDPFSGSGTTIIAAEMTGRKCLAMEISPAYVDLAVIRWQQFTGKEAIHAETGDTFLQISQARKAGAGRMARNASTKRDTPRPLRKTAGKRT